MNNTSNINWNNYLYRGTAIPFVEQLKTLSNTYKQNRLSNIPTRNEQLPRNRYGTPRFAYYGGFTPWTNIPIANKNGGNI